MRARTDPVSARKAVYEAFLSTSGQEIKDKKVLSPCPIISSFRPAFLACWCQPLCCTKLRARARTHTHTHRQARTHTRRRACANTSTCICRACTPKPHAHAYAYGYATYAYEACPYAYDSSSVSLYFHTQTRMRHAHTRMIHPLCPYILLLFMFHSSPDLTLQMIQWSPPVQ